MKDIIFPITYKTDTKGLKDAESGLESLGNFAKKAGLVIAAGLAVASTAAVAFAVQSVKAAAEAEAITKGLENAARNAGVFGEKASSIAKATQALDDHSRALGELTGIDDEIINQIKTGWLAVPSLAALGTDGLNNLAKVVADTAAGTGKDITAIGLAFQRVAGDTENAFSKLTRAGIVFTDEQKNTFQSLLDTNGEIAAQNYLIEQLGQKYAGSAEAMANPFAQIKVLFDNFKETVGGAFLPAIRDIVPVIQKQLNDLANDPKFIKFLQELGEGFAAMLPDLVELLPPLTELALAILPVLIALIPILTDFIKSIIPAIRSTAESFKGAADSGDLWWKLLLKLFPIIDMVRQGVEWLNKTLGPLAGFIVGLFNPIAGIINAFSQWESGLRNLLTLLDRLFGFSGKTVNIKGNLPTGSRGFTVPKLAEGGVVMPTPGGTLAVVGESNQAEAVIPLDRLSEFGGGRSGAVYNINVNAGMGTDGAAVGEQIVNAIRKYERTSGQVFVRA